MASPAVSTSGHDNVNHPVHYTAYPIEVIEVTQYLPFLDGNVVKYVSRWRFKNGLEDLLKARWYLERLIDSLNGDQFLGSCGNLRKLTLNMRVLMDAMHPDDAQVLEGIFDVWVNGTGGATPMDMAQLNASLSALNYLIAKEQGSKAQEVVN